jgi:hypothetical protein
MYQARQTEQERNLVYSLQKWKNSLPHHHYQSYNIAWYKTSDKKLGYQDTPWALGWLGFNPQAGCLGRIARAASPSVAGAAWRFPDLVSELDLPIRRGRAV